MGISSDHNRDLVILEQIEKDPDATQASLASQLGVAVGTINWHLKRLVEKGYVKVRRVERRKLRYLITPEGLALRTHLTIDYIQTSFQLFRLVRQRMVDAIQLVRQAGYSRIRLEGEGDVADVCRLTCLEHGISITQDGKLPLVSVRALKVFVDFSPNGASAATDGTNS
jgi:DNA-binding MarR family transcriptional regulator